MAQLHSLSSILRHPHVITLSFDWLIGLSMSYVIGWIDKFGFGFCDIRLNTALIKTPLHE